MTVSSDARESGDSQHLARSHTDRETIIEAMADLATAIDARRWDRVADAFVSDGQGYGVTGRDAIVAQMRAHLDGCGPTQHLLGNHRVEVDGDRARCRAYARVHHQGAGPMAGAQLEVMGDYDDHWVLRNHRWLLESRTFTMRIVIGPMEVLRPADDEVPRDADA